jgi:small GTP-binding protein
MSKLTLAQEADRRRTFAIIAHPDAGKTTLTEHILLAGGAVRAAGAVKARGENRRARSDWMKIEKERGISVTASVMTFEHDGKMFNLLDTPGHEDFSEDTYRTLTAADCAIMVLDAAKGIEPQTLKLFEVCRLRDIPIITFINKLDREALDPMELLDQIASQLQLDPAPIWWPAQSGNRLRGMVKVGDGTFQPYTKKPAGAAEDPGHPEALPLADAAQYFEAGEMQDLLDAAELVEGGYPAFDPPAGLEGHKTPVRWGSALRHFGIDELLKAGTAAEGPDRAALYASAQQHADELRAHIVGVMLIPTPPVQVEYGGEYGRAVLAHLRDVGTSRRWSPSDLGAAYTACKTMIARRQLAGYGVDHVRVTRLIDYLRSPEGASDRRMSQVSQVLTGDPAAWLSDDPDGPWLRLPESTRAIAVALAVIDGR